MDNPISGQFPDYAAIISAVTGQLIGGRMIGDQLVYVERTSCES